jgi:hypothetical protein
MKRLVISIICSFLILFPVLSQKAVRFIHVDKDSVKVQSMQGINLNIDKNIVSHFPFSYGFWGRLGYFNEFRIGKLSTLSFSGDISFNRTIKDFNINLDDNTLSSNMDITYGIGIYAGLSVDYRLYLFYINRLLKGKNTRLNSGLFLSIPANLTSSDLFPAKDSPFEGHFQLTPYLSPGIGYRHAFSNHFFMEGKAGLTIYGLELGEFYAQPFINVRASYTF